MSSKIWQIFQLVHGWLFVNVHLLLGPSVFFSLHMILSVLLLCLSIALLRSRVLLHFLTCFTHGLDTRFAVVFSSWLFFAEISPVLLSLFPFAFLSPPLLLQFWVWILTIERSMMNQQVPYSVGGSSYSFHVPARHETPHLAVYSCDMISSLTFRDLLGESPQNIVNYNHPGLRGWNRKPVLPFTPSSLLCDDFPCCCSTFHFALCRLRSSSSFANQSHCWASALERSACFSVSKSISSRTCNWRSDLCWCIFSAASICRVAEIAESSPALFSVFVSDGRSPFQVKRKRALMLPSSWS